MGKDFHRIFFADEGIKTRRSGYLDSAAKTQPDYFGFKAHVLFSKPWNLTSPVPKRVISKI